jgi:hypothetical protein
VVVQAWAHETSNELKELGLISERHHQRLQLQTMYLGQDIAAKDFKTLETINDFKVRFAFLSQFFYVLL